MHFIHFSVYGSKIKNAAVYRKIMLVDDVNARKLQSKREFRECIQLAANVFEVELERLKVHIDVSLPTGYFVYQDAKLWIQRFVYDFLKKTFPDSQYELLNMDTDSIYIAIAGLNIHQLERVCGNEIFQQRIEEYLEYNESRQKIPGIAKMESEGDHFCSLAPKTNILWNSIKDKVTKIAHKGVKRSLNQFRFEEFQRVITSVGKFQLCGINRGFRADDERLGLLRYSEQKVAGSYLYVKRKTSSNGYSTKIYYNK